MCPAGVEGTGTGFHEPGDGAPSRMERLHAVLSPASVCRADVPPELHADLWWLWRLASRALEVCEWAEGREGADGSVAPVDDVWLVYSEGGNRG